MWFILSNDSAQYYNCSCPLKFRSLTQTVNIYNNHHQSYMQKGLLVLRGDYTHAVRLLTCRSSNYATDIQLCSF